MRRCGIAITLCGVVLVVGAQQWCAVVTLHGCDELVQRVHEVGCRRSGQVAGQKQHRQFIRLRHAAQRALRAAGLRALALRVARSLASLRR